MKLIKHISIIILFILISLDFRSIYAQVNCVTYSVTGYDANGICPGGISYGCSNGTGNGLKILTYTDAPPVGYGSPVTSVSILTPNGQCPGDANINLNGTFIGNVVSNTGDCSFGGNCIPSTTANFLGSPAGYVINGINNFQVTGANGSPICYNSFDITVCYTQNTVTPTLNEWGLIILGLLILSISSILVWRQKKYKASIS